jgi:hypothetical protein
MKKKDKKQHKKECKDGLRTRERVFSESFPSDFAYSGSCSFVVVVYDDDIRLSLNCGNQQVFFIPLVIYIVYVYIYAPIWYDYEHGATVELYWQGKIE